MKNKKGPEIFRYVWYGAIPLLLLGLGFLSLYKAPLRLTGPVSDSIYIYPYTDQVIEGSSEAVFFKAEDNQAGINVKYILKEGVEYPYAGFGIRRAGDSLFDLHQYDCMRLRIKATKGRRIPFGVTTDVENYTTKDNNNSYRPLEYTFDVTDQFKVVEVKLDELRTPVWWFNMVNKPQSEFGPPDFSRIRHINLSNCQLIKKGEEDQVEVSEVSFYVDMSWYYILSASFLVLYYLAMGIVILRKRKNAKTEITFQYEKTESKNQLEEEEKKVFGYLTTHYDNPDLTIIEVQNAVGIHEQKISGMIKKKTDLNFKQFLNKLRISEAKRLLSETDLQIAQIAFQVGYANASHFNRVFKESEKCSPNDYRRKFLEDSQ